MTASGEWNDWRDWPNGRIVEGIITQEIVDKQQDIIQLDSLDMSWFARSGHLVLEHGKSNAGVVVLGECLGWRQAGDSIMARFGVYDGNEIIDKCWGMMVQAGDKGAFSIAGVPTKDPICDDDTGICRYSGVCLTEVSFTLNPANPAAKVQFINAEAKSRGVMAEVMRRYDAWFRSIPEKQFFDVKKSVASCPICKQFVGLAKAEGMTEDAAVLHLTTALNNRFAATRIKSPMPDAPPPAETEKKPDAPPTEEEPQAESAEAKLARIEPLVMEMYKAFTAAKAQEQPAAPPPPANAPPAPAQKAVEKAEPPAAPLDSAAILKVLAADPEGVKALLKQAGFSIVTPQGTAPASSSAPSGLTAPASRDALIDEVMSAEGGIIAGLNRKKKVKVN